MNADAYILGIDLDGTLFNDNKEISRYTQSILEESSRLGHFIVPVTGRPISGIPLFLRDADFVRFIITSNGARIYDKEKHEFVYEKCLSGNLCAELYGILRNRAQVFEIFVGGVGYESEESYNNLYNRYTGDSYRNYIKMSRKTVSCLQDFFQNVKVDEIAAMFSEDDKPDSLMGVIREQYRVQLVEMGSNDFEIFDMEAGKGNALLFLAKILNIPEARIMCFGDSKNDIPMLNISGVSVAMENADQAVKDIADYITADNNHDGVGKMIKKYLL